MAPPKGFRHTEESRRKMSAAGTGRRWPSGSRKPSSWGEGSRHSEESKLLISKNRVGKRRLTEAEKLAVSKRMKGRVVSEETRRKLREARKKQVGSKCPNWKGGHGKTPYPTSWTETLRRSIRERDHYVCRICSVPQGDKAHDVHHIDYDKNNCDPINLITLCNSCHVKTNYNRDYWINHIKNLIGQPNTLTQ